MLPNYAFDLRHAGYSRREKIRRRAWGSAGTLRGEDVQHIGILGAGYAGLRAAQDLARGEGYAVTIIDNNPYHQLITRLPEVVGGSLSPNKARIPLANVVSAGTRIVTGSVTLIDATAKSIRVGGQTTVFDILLVALGTRPSPPGNGAGEGVYTVKSLEGAIALRDALCRLDKQAVRRRITIVGAGYTGTEVAGEICTWASKQGLNVEVVLLSDEPRVLPSASPALAHTAERILHGKGIILQMDRPVVDVAANRVALQNGDVIEADVVVWAGASVSGIPHTDGTVSCPDDGRVQVDPFFLGAHKDVYFVGDTALVPDFQHGGFLPASAQMAVQHGELVARNLAAVSRGVRPSEFRPRLLGEALTFGGGAAVGEVAGVVVTGRIAAGIKSAALLRYLSLTGGPSLTAAYL